MYFGYFGTVDGQVEATREHINLLFEAMWGGLEPSIARMRAAGVPTILGIDWACFTPTTPRQYLGTATVQANLRALFDRLRAEALLEQVVALYPLDEPEVAGVSAATLTQCCVDVRAVAAEYADLACVKLGIIYSDRRDYRALREFDWIGVDSYDHGASILAPGALVDQLRGQFCGHQRLLLVPGGASPWRADPSPFYAYAQNHPQSIALLAFIWPDHWGGTQNLGIQSNGMQAAYAAVGKAIKDGATVSPAPPSAPPVTPPGDGVTGEAPPDSSPSAPPGWIDYGGG